MKKSDCEKKLRPLCHEWASTLPPVELEHPSFLQFKEWLRQNHYSHYLDFRSIAGADYDAEVWFDQELKQMWRR